MKLAKVIGGVPGKLTKIDENASEYYCLECVVSDEMADVAIAAGLRKPRTVDYLARKTGKLLKLTRKLALQLADTGVFTVWTDDKEDRFYLEIFAPGTLERMVGNREQLAKYPQIGRAFEEYTRNLGAKMSPMLPMGSGLMRVIPIESSIRITKMQDRMSICHTIWTNMIFTACPTAPAVRPEGSWTRAADIWNMTCAFTWGLRRSFTRGRARQGM